MSWYEKEDNIRTVIYLGLYLLLLVVIGVVSAIRRFRLLHAQAITSRPVTPNGSIGNHESFSVDITSTPSSPVTQSETFRSVSDGDYHTPGLSSSFSHSHTDRSVASKGTLRVTHETQSHLSHLSCDQCIKLVCSFNFCMSWMRDTFTQRSIYGTVIVYAFDIVTDINVMILWFNQGELFFGFMALMILVFYRIVSCYSVYEATARSRGKLYRLIMAISQVLDLYIFVEVFASHQNKKKSDRLRWINKMESALEAAPQIILQSVYLITRKTTELNTLVVLGLIFSVLKLGTTIISADKLSVTRDAKDFHISYKYYIRFFFRIFEISSRVFLYVLICVIINGYVFGVIMVLHVIHNLFLFYAGCLGREVFNVFGYIILIPQINTTLQEGKQIATIAFFTNNCYTKFYRNCKFEQTRMILVRTVELIIYAISIFCYSLVHNGHLILYVSDGNSTAHEELNQLLIAIMFDAATIMALLTPALWWWIVKLKIIDTKKKREQIAFKNVFEAIKLGRLDAIKKQFNNANDIMVNVIDKKTMRTPLHYACKYNQGTIVAWMINDSGFMHQSGVNKLDALNQTPFFTSCKYGALECAKILSASPFIIQIDIENSRGHSILSSACAFGHSNIVNYLLNELFVINIQKNGNINDSSNVNQDHTDQQTGCEIVTTNQEHTNSVNITNDLVQTITQHVNIFDSTTALHAACKLGDLKCVQHLLNNKSVTIDINSLDNTNNAAIHIATYRQDFDISSMLVKDARFQLSDDNMKKLWYYSLIKDDLGVFKKLLSSFDIFSTCKVFSFENNSNTRSPTALDDQNKTKNLNTYDNTPLFIVCEHNCGKIVEMILKLITGTDGAKFALGEDEINKFLNSTNGQGHSPLYVACKYGSDHAALAILNSTFIDQIDILFATEREGNTILHSVCEGGSKKILTKFVKILKSKSQNLEKFKQEINKVNKFGQTAIYIACKCDSHLIADALVNSWGWIDLDAKDNNGKTPLMIAKELNNQKTIQVLELIENFGDDAFF